MHSRLPAAITTHHLLSVDQERLAFEVLNAARVSAWTAVLGHRCLSPRCLPTSAAAMPPHALWDSAREAAVMRPTAQNVAAMTAAVPALAAGLAAADLELDDLRSAAAEVGRLAVRGSTPAAWVRRVGAAMADLAAAVDHVERHNLRLVFSIARRYAPRAGSLTLADLVGHGAVGLRTAVLRFDLSRGFRFTTMATNWVRHRICRAVQNESREIRIPAHVLEVVGKVSKVVDRAVTETGVAPSLSEVAAKTRTSVHAAANAIDVGRGAWRPVSLERTHTFDGGEDSSLRERLADPDAVDAVESIDHARRMAVLRQALGTLTERERLVIEARFGMLSPNDDMPANLREIGRALRLSGERIRQVEALAMAKLRDAAGVRLERQEHRPAPAVPAWRASSAEQVALAL